MKKSIIVSLGLINIINSSFAADPTNIFNGPGNRVIQGQHNYAQGRDNTFDGSRNQAIGNTNYFVGN